MKRAVLYVGLLLASLLALGWAFVPKPSEVEVAAVIEGVFEQSIEEDGRTRLRERYLVSAPVAGRASRIVLRQGDDIERDALITTIQPSMPAMLDARTEATQRHRVEAAEATLAASAARVSRAQVALAQARVDLQRTEALAARGFVSPNKVEGDRLGVRLSQEELSSAREQQHAAQHELDVAHAALRQFTAGAAPAGRVLAVRAPISGRALRVLRESEGDVALGAGLVEIGNLDRIEVVAPIVTVDAARIPAGAPVVLDRWGGAAALHGRVRLVEPSAFTKLSALGVEEQRVDVVIDLLSPPDQWRALGDNFRVNVRIIVHCEDNAVQAPVGALFKEGAADMVFVVADGRVSKRTVQVAARNRSSAWVQTGLRVGEQVILYPSDAIGDGARVRVRTQNPAPWLETPPA